MTYIVGWKYGDNIYLVSDTVLSRRNSERVNKETSSLGEEMGKKGEYSVNEECFKIVQIGDDCLIAISGCVNNAIEFIEHVIKHCNSTNQYEFIKKYAFNYRDQEFDAIIALNIAGELKLFSLECNSNPVFKEVKVPFISLGSGVVDIRNKTKALIGEIKGKNKTTEEILHQFVAGHQLISINDNLLDKGVGGIFNGAKLSKNGIKWNVDVAYILYSQNTDIIPELAEVSGDSDFITVFNRGKMIYVASPYLSQVTSEFLIPNCMLFNSKASTEYQSIIKEWESKNLRSINNNIHSDYVETEFIAFLYKDFEDNYKLLSITKEYLKKHGMKISYIKDGDYELKFKEDKLKKLITIRPNKVVECELLK